MRAFVGDLHESATKNSSELPPIYLATLRNGMLKLAHEIADGAICGMGALSHMTRQFNKTGVRPDNSFFVGNMAAAHGDVALHLHPSAIPARFRPVQCDHGLDSTHN